MENCERKRLKNNSELIETVFRMLFETLWVAPYDRRRQHSLLLEFEYCAREAVKLLGKVDFAAASHEQAGDALRSVERLCESVRHLSAARIFAPGRIGAALVDAERVRLAVRRACDCAAAVESAAASK